MSKTKYTYNLAEARPSERQDRNIDRMNRWERANGMTMASLTRSEWIDVASHILGLTASEAEEYLNHLTAKRAQLM